MDGALRSGVGRAGRAALGGRPEGAAGPTKTQLGQRTRAAHDTTFRTEHGPVIRSISN